MHAPWLPLHTCPAAKELQQGCTDRCALVAGACLLLLRWRHQTPHALLWQSRLCHLQCPARNTQVPGGSERRVAQQEVRLVHSISLCTTAPWPRPVYQTDGALTCNTQFTKSKECLHSPAGSVCAPSAVFAQHPLKLYSSAVFAQHPLKL